MLFELRQYFVRPGQQQNWVSLMEQEIIPFQVKMGMVILRSFVGEDDDSTYVWIRRFENEEERQRLYDLVYQSDYWKNEIAPKVPAMLDREKTNVQRLVATPKSAIQYAGAPGYGRMPAKGCALRRFGSHSIQNLAPSRCYPDTPT